MQYAFLSCVSTRGTIVEKSFTEGTISGVFSTEKPLQEPYVHFHSMNLIRNLRGISSGSQILLWEPFQKLPQAHF